MFLELLVEMAGALLLRAGIRKASEARDLSFFEALTPEQKATFADIAVAAILRDGLVSSREAEWLARRRTGGGDDDLLDASLARVKGELPSDAPEEDLVEFLKGRAAQLEGDAREKAFDTAAAFLLAGEPIRGDDSAEWKLLHRLGGELGWSEGRVDRKLAWVVGRLQGALP